MLIGLFLRGFTSLGLVAWEVVVTQKLITGVLGAGKLLNS